MNNRLASRLLPRKLPGIVTRWLFILLAVVLGWLAPSNAQARAWHPSPITIAEPLAEKAASVAGITRDTFEGRQSDPLSLHKYLYAHASPVNNIDPSGQMSISDVGAALTKVGYFAANLGIRAVPAITRATAITFEATTGQMLLIGGAGAGAVAAGSQLRNLPGIVKGVGKAIISGQWFRGSHGNLAPIPEEIGKQLSGRSFSNFGQFREAFWKLVAEAKDLAKNFSPQNVTRMKSGYAPIAHDTQQVGGKITYELHHIKPIQHGGDVYDLSNLVIVSPRYHQEVLDPLYHY